MTAGLWAGSPEPAPARMTSVVHSDTRSGKLVRSLVVSSRVVGERSIAPELVAPRPVGSTAVLAAETQETPVPQGINELVETIAAQHNLPPQLIHAVIKVESNYNSTAISPKGALGLMQLIPATARRFGVAHAFDPVENIQGGARYLKYLVDLYDGNYPLVLAAYNAGEAAVAKYNGIPPYPETQNYVILVKNHLEKLVAAMAKQAPVPQPDQAVAAVPAGPNHVKEIVDADGTVHYVSR